MNKTIKNIKKIYKEYQKATEKGWEEWSDFKAEQIKQIFLNNGVILRHMCYFDKALKELKAR